MPNFLFTNANLVLDGFAELQPSYDVLVKDNYIETVSSTPINCGDATVVDVGGRTLMPGLIDAHAHITGLSLSPKNASYPQPNIVIAAVDYLRNSLLDGFTTIREAGGADYSIARLLAQGEIVGPRLFYSGRALTQTGGGADFRTPYELTDPCGHVSPFSVMSVIADGVDEVAGAGSPGRGDHAEQAEAHRVGQRSEGGGQLNRLILIDRRVQDRAALEAVRTADGGCWGDHVVLSLMY